MYLRAFRVFSKGVNKGVYMVSRGLLCRALQRVLEIFLQRFYGALDFRAAWVQGVGLSVCGIEFTWTLKNLPF